MNTIIFAVLILLLVPLISPFLYGFLGIFFIAIVGLIIYRYSSQRLLMIILFLLTLLNDVAFHTLLGSTFVAISLAYFIELLFRRFIPSDTPLIDLILSFITFFIFIVFFNMLIGISTGNGLKVFEGSTEVYSSLVASLIMSATIVIYSKIRGYISGDSRDHKIIRIK